MQMPAKIGTVHIVGIGGIGMSAIAEILHAKGYVAQGSDQKESPNVKRLRAKGIRVFVGHDPPFNPRTWIPPLTRERSPPGAPSAR